MVSMKLFLASMISLTVGSSVGLDDGLEDILLDGKSVGTDRFLDCVSDDSIDG